MTDSHVPVLAYQRPHRPNQPPFSNYRPSRAWGIVTIVLVGVSTLFSVANVICLDQQAHLLESAKKGLAIPPAQANSNDLRVSVTAGVAAVLVLPAAVAWLIWSYRAYSNLRALTGHATSHSPGWAIGAYFVPFLNLVRVPQIMVELWDSSKPVESNNATLPAVWWLLWLVAGVVSSVGDSMMQTSAGAKPDLDSLVSGTWVLVAAQIARILCGAAGVAIVIGVVSRQERKWTLVRPTE
jgi:hypothetical protein